MYQFTVSRHAVFNNLHHIFETGRILLRKLSEAIQEFGWIPVIIAGWNTLNVGIQLLIFWLYMFDIRKKNKSCPVVDFK
jgi:hypothetical protein